MGIEYGANFYVIQYMLDLRIFLSLRSLWFYLFFTFYWTLSFLVKVKVDSRTKLGVSSKDFSFFFNGRLKIATFQLSWLLFWPKIWQNFNLAMHFPLCSKRRKIVMTRKKTRRPSLDAPRVLLTSRWSYHTKKAILPWKKVLLLLLMA